MNLYICAIDGATNVVTGEAVSIVISNLLVEDNVVAEDNRPCIVLYRYEGIQGRNGTATDTSLVMFETDVSRVAGHLESATSLHVNCATGTTGHVVLETDVACIVCPPETTPFILQSLTSVVNCATGRRCQVLLEDDVAGIAIHHETALIPDENRTTATTGNMVVLNMAVSLIFQEENLTIVADFDHAIDSWAGRNSATVVHCVIIRERNILVSLHRQNRIYEVNGTAAYIHLFYFRGLGIIVFI